MFARTKSWRLHMFEKTRSWRLHMFYGIQVVLSIFIFKLFIEFLIQEYTFIYIYTILYRLSETHSVAKKKYCFFMGIALLSRVGHRIRHGRLPSFLVLHVPCGHHGRHGGHHPSACCLLSGVARHLSCPRFSVKRLSSSLFSMG